MDKDERVFLYTLQPKLEITSDLKHDFVAELVKSFCLESILCRERDLNPHDVATT